MFLLSGTNYHSTQELTRTVLIFNELCYLSFINYNRYFVGKGIPIFMDVSTWRELRAYICFGENVLEHFNKKNLSVRLFGWIGSGTFHRHNKYSAKYLKYEVDFKNRWR